MPGSQDHFSDSEGNPDPYAIFEQTPDAIFFIKNSELKFEKANYAFAKLCGAQYPADLHGHTSRKFFSSELAKMYEIWDTNLLNSGLTMLSRFHQTKSFREKRRWLFGTRMVRHDQRNGGLKIVSHSRLMPTFRNSNRIYTRLQIATSQLATPKAKPPSIKMLADMAACSVSQLNRDFARFLGMSPLTYKTEQQIQRAKDLIRAKLKLVDVALECGFYDQSEFSRCFKKSVGIRPTDYVRFHHDFRTSKH